MRPPVLGVAFFPVYIRQILAWTMNACARHAGGMAKKRKPIDDMIDAHVWMRRKAKQTRQRRAPKSLARRTSSAPKIL